MIIIITRNIVAININIEIIRIILLEVISLIIILCEM